MVNIGAGGLFAGQTQGASDLRARERQQLDEDKFDSERKDKLIGQISTTSDILLKNISDQHLY